MRIIFLDENNISYDKETMSNYHYDDQSSVNYEYQRLNPGDTWGNHKCSAECICEQNGQRSKYDQMFNAHYEKGAPMNLGGNAVLAKWPGYQGKYSCKDFRK